VVIICTINLKTQRLLLRTTRHDDLDAVAALWGDPEGGQYLPDPCYTCGSEIAEILEDDPECPVYYFVALLVGSDEVMGTCSLGLENAESSTYSIGYDVKKDYWGNGYAVEMVHALIDFAREQGMKSITAPVAQANNASKRVMEKCGFFIDGTSSFIKSGTNIVHPTFIYRLNL